jgi:hypothetical protein
MKPTLDIYGHLFIVLPVMALILPLSSCARLNSIQRNKSLPKDKPHVISIDAKQRVILSNPVKPATNSSLKTLSAAKKDADAKRADMIKKIDEAIALVPSGPCGDIPLDESSPPSNATVDQAKAKNAKCAEAAKAAKLANDAEEYYALAKETVAKDRNPEIVRFCAEPPPDVFTALASSLGAEATVSQSTSTEVAAKLAATISENAATIERTQTVNILREAMYRNCERYLSGAISEDEFIVQASRDQQLIVQVLAVEQITGVAKSQSTALTTVAKSASAGVSDASLEVLADAKKDADEKRADRSKKADEAKALAPSGPCSDTPLDESSPPISVTAEQAKAKNAKCAEVAEAAKLANEAEEYYALVKETVAKQGSVSSETQGKLATAALTASEASSEIARQVVEIVRQYQAFDEIGMSCVVRMRTTGDLPEFCKDLLQQMAKTRTAQLGIEEDRLNAVRVKSFLSEMNQTTKSEAEIVWEKIGKEADPTRLNELFEKARIVLPDAHKKRLEAAKKDFGEFLKAFEKLPIDKQKELAKAATMP